MKTDLHIHSNWSDGSLGIPHLVRLAKTLGIDVISITDHDTVSGQEQTLEEGKRQGVRIIPGIEISAFNPGTGRKTHILGYNVKDTNTLERTCRPFLRLRHEKNLEALHLVETAGYPITAEAVKSYAALDGTVYRQHIMHALIDRGFELSIYGPLYKKLFGNGGLAVVKTSYMSAEEAVKLICNCGGVAVLAHPFMYDSMDFIPQLAQWGLSGLEYQHHTQTQERQEAVINAAGKYNLFLTGGSDFHGFYSEKALPPGSTGTELPPEHPLIKPKPAV